MVERDNQLSYVNYDLEKPFIEIEMYTDIKHMKLRNFPWNRPNRL